jgi:hypothetical protein
MAREIKVLGSDIFHNHAQKAPAPAGLNSIALTFNLNRFSTRSTRFSPLSLDCG